MSETWDERTETHSGVDVVVVLLNVSLPYNCYDYYNGSLESSRTAQRIVQ